MICGERLEEESKRGTEGDTEKESNKQSPVVDNLGPVYKAKNKKSNDKNSGVDIKGTNERVEQTGFDCPHLLSHYFNIITFQSNLDSLFIHLDIIVNITIIIIIIY